MHDSENIESLRLQHAAVRSKLPRSWNAFFAGFGRLRPIQLEAMPVIVSGANTLVTAPTAGGKTEATVAPICERLLAERWPGLSVLLVTPTRALVNDLFERLTRPLSSLNIPLGRKTSDHAISENASEQVLITTPESVESLLTFRKSRLAHVRAVILDEIHLLDGTPRGDQLRTILQRLALFRRQAVSGETGSLQRVAMSATVADPERLAGVFLGNPHEVVAVRGQREISSRVLLAPDDDHARAEAALGAIDALGDCRKVLVFVNSRKQVDTARIFAKGSFERLPVYGHHGSLSKDRREEVEDRFKRDERALCVATMTLEVGIDIGDIDLVVCMDPPFSLSSFLQRIGRGCRRLQGRTRVICVARDLAGKLMFDALILQASRGIPAGPSMPYRRSVLVQQILAYLRQADHHQRTRDQFVAALSSGCLPTIAPEMVDQVLADMVSSGLLAEHKKVFEPGAGGRGIIESDRIYSNIAPSPKGLTVVDVETGETIANVGSVRKAEGGVRVAGRDYKIVAGGMGGVLRVRASEGGGQSPRYHARSLPYSFDMGAALRSLLGFDHRSLAVVEGHGVMLVLTWLGRLYNSALEAALKSIGVRAKASSFAIGVEASDLAEVKRLLQQAVAKLMDRTLCGQMRVESLVDLGPFFGELSEAEQQVARADTLDERFLQKWSIELHDVVLISGDDPRAGDIRALAEVE